MLIFMMREQHLFVQPVADGKEWRTHLETTGKHNDLIKEVFPDTRTVLSKLHGELKKSTERIAFKERSINRDFEALGGEFAQRQREYDDLRQRFEDLTKVNLLMIFILSRTTGFFSSDSS